MSKQDKPNKNSPPGYIVTTEDILGQPHPEVVSKLLDYLVKSLNQYLEHNQIDFVDMFMLAHNFHKMCIINVVEAMEAPAYIDALIFASADQTFGAAMKEFVRTAKQMADESGDEIVHIADHQEISGTNKVN